MKSGEINPYTQAMKNCLQQFPANCQIPELDENTSQFLANMIQGRFLQFLVTLICLTFDISGKVLEKQLSMKLMNILSDKFFAVFREKVKKNPEIVYLVAKKITTYETLHNNHPHRMNALFRGICRYYFKYQNIELILQWIFSNPDVEKIIFLSRVSARIKDPALIKAFVYILQNDKHGIAPTVFNRYLEKNKIERLSHLVQSGDWKIEAAFIQEQSAKMFNWQEYMSMS